MRLIHLIDDQKSGSSGYKFDLLDAETKAVVKVFAKREALFEAIATAGPKGSFELVLIEAANAKYDGKDIEDDGLILIEKDDLAN